MDSTFQRNHLSGSPLKFYWSPNCIPQGRGTTRLDREASQGVVADCNKNSVSGSLVDERTATPRCVVDNMYITNNNNNCDSVMDVDSSRSVAEDYIRYRLERNGLSWQNGQRDVTPNEIQRAMRALGDEFESRFSQTFDDMINQLHITPDTAYQTFRTIVHEIFSDGVNWGRIVALFGFGGKLAVRCVQQSMPQLVNSIVDWVSVYVDTTLRPWISANNGWAGFLEFYEGGPEKRTKDSWPSFKTICSYAAAGLGILTLGAFLSQKS
ncbi:bcl-2-like protein 2 isoform X1 [Babylonia areolata]|uniref:bcl-2-like protein 2 isoform X1 n=2 Tax=Babylonia areolata TaxID=304850 RepID=UPI003FD54767